MNRYFTFASLLRLPFYAALLVALTPFTLYAAQETPTLIRNLPLNQFAVSRENRGNAHGFYTMATAIGDDYFDGTSSQARVRRHMAVAHLLGVKYLRCAFSWNGIEPQSGNYNWAFWDNLVSEAHRNNIELIPYVAYTPKWAVRNPEKDFWKEPPRTPALYAQFMYDAATRYRGQIKSWEIWNEPDNQDYWTGSA